MMPDLRENLLRKFIKVLINEAIGSSFVESEKLLRDKLELAELEHAEWEYERAKKDALDILVTKAAREKGLSSNAQKVMRTRLRADPKLNYNEKILQKSEQKLLDAIQRIEEELGAYDIDKADIKKLSQPKVEMVDGATPPPKDKKSYVTPSSLPHMTLLSWEDPRWKKPASRVELGFGSKTPPGEERLAEIFGAQRQGDKVSFDLVDQEGKRWEVKGLLTKGGKIRPGKQGAVAFVKAAKYMVQVCAQMQQFSSEIKRQGETKVCTNERQLKAARLVDIIMKSEFKEIAGKELSEERLLKVLLAMRATAFLKVSWEADIGDRTGGTLLHDAGDINIKDRRAWIDIMSRIAKQPGGKTALDGIAPREKCLFKLQDKHAFTDPVRWMDNWEDHIDVNYIFADVDGLIIVLPEGFFIIPPDMLKQALVFKGVSQDVPRYAVKFD